MISSPAFARLVVLNFNGADLLRKCLPSLCDAAKTSRFPCAVTVLDNGSSDDSETWIRTHFPEVEFVRAPENLILCSYNDYLQSIREPVAVLLNNDIRVDEHFLDPLLRRFKDDPSVFLVAPKVMSFDGTKVEAGRAKAGLRFGFFWCDARYPGYEREVDKPSETVSSGFGAFSRDKFLILGGYDKRFFPGIMEDVDLCFRARNAGYRLYYEPASTVYHMGQASFKKAYGSKKIAVIAHRNNFLFMWKNFKGFSFWGLHLLFLPIRLLYGLMKGQKEIAQGFFLALTQKTV